MLTRNGAFKASSLFQNVQHLEKWSWNWEQTCQENIPSEGELACPSSSQGAPTPLEKQTLPHYHKFRCEAMTFGGGRGGLLADFHNDRSITWSSSLSLIHRHCFYYPGIFREALKFAHIKSIWNRCSDLPFPLSSWRKCDAMTMMQPSNCRQSSDWPL